MLILAEQQFAGEARAAYAHGSCKVLWYSGKMANLKLPGQTDSGYKGCEHLELPLR